MRSSFTADQLLDACLYELGCWELEEKSRRVILGDVGEMNVAAGDEAFDEAVTRMFEYIAFVPRIPDGLRSRTMTTRKPQTP